MDAKQQQLEREKAERQLDETQARLKMLDATAREHQADGAIAEVSGLTALHDRIRDRLRSWQAADAASVDELGDEVRSANEALSRATEEAAVRLDRFSEATDEWLDAEADQVGAAVALLYARIGEAWIVDQQLGENAGEELRVGLDETRRNQEALRDAAPAKRNEARHALRASLEKITNKLKELAARLKREPKGVEQRT